LPECAELIGHRFGEVLIGIQPGHYASSFSLQWRNPPLAVYCQACAAPLGSSGSPAQGDAIGGIIPYEKPPALIAYYLGLFSAFPVIRFLLGIASVFLGIAGLKKHRQMPEVKGTVHAWIGIGCGSLAILVWGTSIVLIIIAMLSSIKFNLARPAYEIKRGHCLFSPPSVAA
jgi:hypothetical protein